MITRTPYVSKLALFVLACALIPYLAAMPAGPDRLVAVPDIHGAYPEFVSVLQRTALVDKDLRWTGGSTLFIQIGDVLDRGSRVKDCLDLIMALERQAGKAGGKVVPLLGNHEVMNLMSDLRYVTPEIYRTFATENSEKVRQRAWRDYLSFASAHREHGHGTVYTDDDTSRGKWMDAHPPGFFEYVDAMRPDGRYGSWIRKHRAIVQAGDGLFVHGGLNPALQFRSVADLDDRVRAEIQNFDTVWQALCDRRTVWRYMTWSESVPFIKEELAWIQAHGLPDDPSVVDGMQTLLAYRNWLSWSANGPLWYRGLAQDPEEGLRDGVAAMLQRLNARYIVDGHTVLSKSGITGRFGDSVFLIDAGMNKEAFNGRASALEVKDGKFTVYYGDGETKVLAPPGNGK